MSDTTNPENQTNNTSDNTTPAESNLNGEASSTNNISETDQNNNSQIDNSNNNQTPEQGNNTETNTTTETSNQTNTSNTEQLPETSTNTTNTNSQVKITCTLGGSCSRSDNVQLIPGFQSKHKILLLGLEADKDRYKAQTIISLNPFENSQNLNFLPGSSKYVCADGFSECNVSCCNLGLCTDPRNVCLNLVGLRDRMIFVPCLFFLLFLILYWALYIYIGVKYSKKKSAVVKQNSNKENKAVEQFFAPNLAASGGLENFDQDMPVFTKKTTIKVINDNIEEKEIKSVNPNSNQFEHKNQSIFNNDVPNTEKLQTDRIPKLNVVNNEKKETNLFNSQIIDIPKNNEIKGKIKDLSESDIPNNYEEVKNSKIDKPKFDEINVDFKPKLTEIKDTNRSSNINQEKKSIFSSNFKVFNTNTNTNKND